MLYVRFVFFSDGIVKTQNGITQIGLLIWFLQVACVATKNRIILMNFVNVISNQKDDYHSHGPIT